jgi:phage gp29-like protein
MKRGIWVSPKEFRSFAAVDKTRSLSDEIATRQRSIDFYSLGMYLPNPDPVLKKMGKDISVYKELRSDPIVHGCITSRKAGTKKLLWEIDRGKAKSRQAKYLTEAITALPVDRMIAQVLNAPLYGYQVLETMWDEKTWTPKDLVAKPCQWFVFDENNELRFRTKQDVFLGEKLPEKKFLLATHDADYENPYGFPILSACFWPVTFRKGGFKFWVTFTEKFGMPFIVGKQPRGTGKEETEAFADMLEQMVQDAIAVIPDDASVEIPETKNTGSADLYDKLIAACKSEISVALLGHSGGALSTPGKLGGEDQAITVREDIVDGDKKIVEETFNTLIDWIAFYNFSERVDLPRFIMYEEEDVDQAQAERDKLLADTGQVKFTKKYFMKTYAFEEEDIEIREPAPEMPTGGQGAGGTGIRFARRGDGETGRRGDEIDDALASMDPAELQGQMEGVLKPVIGLINAGTSYDEIMKQLTSTYPEMDTAGIEDLLARAIFVAEAWGRLTASQESGVRSQEKKFSMREVLEGLFGHGPARMNADNGEALKEVVAEFGKQSVEAIRAISAQKQDIHVHMTQVKGTTEFELTDPATGKVVRTLKAKEE